MGVIQNFAASRAIGWEGASGHLGGEAKGGRLRQPCQGKEGEVEAKAVVHLPYGETL
jgi:hypothetical protein